MPRKSVPVQQIPSTLRRAYSAQVRGFRKSLKSLRKRQTPSRVHDLRVRTRRLQALLEVAAAGSPGPEIRKAGRRLQRLAHSLGQVRKWDVAQKDARHYHLHPKFRKKRRKAKKHNRAFIENPEAKKLLRELGQARRSFQHLSRGKAADGLRNLNARITKYDHREIRSMQELHRLRILMKSLQYTFETLGRNSSAIETLQRQIGRGHDLDFLRKHAGKKRRMKKDRDHHAENARKLIPTVLNSTHHQLNSLTGNAARGA